MLKGRLGTSTGLAAAWLLGACVLGLPARLFAQVAPSAYASAGRLWAGAEYSNFAPDFGPSKRISGVAAYADWNLNGRLGVEGEARFLRFNGFSGESQDNYLIGPKIKVIQLGKLKPYAKILIGIGQDHFPFAIGTGRYFALAPGAGVEYRSSRRIIFRVEYEYQFWPSAPGIQGEPSNGMRPNGLSVGVAYRLFDR